MAVDNIEDIETPAATDPTLNTVDFGLQIGVEEILVDVDPDVSLEFLKKAEAHAGKPPPTRVPREILLETHNNYVEQQQKAGQEKAPRMVKKVVLALSYPPSTKAIQDLSPMRLDELLVENHHEDKYLAVKTISLPYRGAGTITVVEDEHGNVDKMALYNQGDSSVLQSIPEGTVVIIKEPYYKFSGDNDYMLCIDHPSDIVRLRQGPDESLIPEPFKEPEELKAPNEWSKAGDEAFISKNLPLAVANYTRALELAPSNDQAFKIGVLSKRAGINLTLKCFDNALSDALESRGGSSDWKAYFIAAKASYGLTDFKASKGYFESALELKPPTANVQREYERCLARLEEEAGNYNLAAMSKDVTAKNIHIDRASFLSRTEIRDSPHHGRGLFATEDIKAGELVFAEKATSVPNEFNPEHNSAAAYAQLIELCADNPTVHKKVLDLYGGSYKRSGLEGTEVDGKPVVDVFLLESIRRKNCFSGAQVSAEAANAEWNMWKQGMSRGLWVYSAYANHACLPNCNRSFIGDMLLVRATVDIPKETEITHIYLPPKAAYLLRVPQFRRSWGFTCSCVLCAGEEKSSIEQHKKRVSALAELQAAMKKRNPARFQPDATIRQIEKLANKLATLHEPEVYDELNLPRLMLVWPTMWLMEAWHTRKQWNKAIKWGHEVFRNFGFVEPVREGRLWMYKDTLAVTTFEVVKALKLTAQAYAALGQDVLSQDCLDAARVGLTTMVGFVTDESFETFK
ncbi:protein lysine methyltransferase SET5 [Colletotrichum truncatum]|uniref:Protein lysine methyltransferase SET5 n=1 Tax=Colletotrichum truncatum TaxID=5467 RepID=A0ACC3YJX1_COLTU|nr:protein lysine methyltransferase SET5 [Colletotrichum truncatum]KAF6797432.1 protein lysine methyltransferase SET5 [Colletotrichum truncatum]